MGEIRSDVADGSSCKGSRRPLASLLTLLLFATLVGGGLGGGISQAQESTTDFEVNGTITDTDGAGVATMCVYAEASEAASDARYGESVETDATGGFEITLQVPGSQQTAEGRLMIYDCDWEGRLEAKQGYVLLGANDFGTYSEDVVHEAATPLVVEETAYRGAYVHLEAESPQGERLEDCDRQYGPMSPAPDTHMLNIAWCEGYADGYVGDTRSPADAEQLTFDEGEVSMHTVVLQPQGRVKGSIVDAATGKQPDTCVQVYERVGGVRGYASQRVMPEWSDGTFDLGVAAGDTYLEFDQCFDGADDAPPFPYGPQFYDDQPTIEQADAISVPVGGVVPGIDVTLYPDDWAFRDVPTDHPFEDEIAWMVDQGITQGYSDGTFRPGAEVTRQAAMAFLFRLVGEPGGEYSNDFSDVPTTHPFHDEISWGAEQGLTGGYSDGTFRPGAGVARQAIAAFLHRLPRATITGHITDADGADHQEAEVILWWCEDPGDCVAVRFDETDEQGGVRFTVLDPGDYSFQVWAEADSMRCSWGSETVAVELGDEKHIDLSLDPAEADDCSAVTG